ELIGYRPRRRAVVRVTVRDRAFEPRRLGEPLLLFGDGRHGPRRALGAPRAFYIKILRASHFEAVSHRHRLLAAGGLPSPRVLATTPDQLLLIAETTGMPLARAIFTEALPVSGDEIVTLLDSMPPAVAELERRPPWASSIAHYARIVQSVLPDLGGRLDYLTQRVEEGLAHLPLGDEATHGDFYEAQIFVHGGHISGLIDIDTIGPGRRADDLACLIAHLNCIQRMTAGQARQVAALIGRWQPAFDARVDPVELRLRAAAVAVSLATGPYRGQEPDWERETRRMVSRAEDLVAAAETLSLGRRLRVPAGV
ncbi:MAG: aminoglycoside phosphotransferase family protein, partial [Propionibacteriaceae bacterium]|nr:aminoglycoside phosphotransferase family protein [Propionibacteriaceae bacterium]